MRKDEARTVIREFPRLVEMVDALVEREPWCLQEAQLSDALIEDIQGVAAIVVRRPAATMRYDAMPLATVCAHLPAPYRISFLQSVSRSEPLIEAIVTIPSFWASDTVAASRNVCVSLEWVARRLLQEALFGEARVARVETALKKASGRGEGGGC